MSETTRQGRNIFCESNREGRRTLVRSPVAASTGRPHFRRPVDHLQRPDVSARPPSDKVAHRPGPPPKGLSSPDCCLGRPFLDLCVPSGIRRRCASCHFPHGTKTFAPHPPRHLLTNKSFVSP